MAAIRHFFNRWHVGRRDWWILGAAAVGAVALAIVLAPEDAAGGDDRSPTPRRRRSSPQRCVDCHSGASAPLGVQLDGLGQDAALRGARSSARSSANAMPPGNATGMTDEERGQLVAWAAAAR